LALSLSLLGGASLPGTLDVSLVGLRSAKGLVQVCLTARPDKFPGCKGDPNAHRLTVAASQAATFAFHDLPAGEYAMALIHDENANNKLDTMLGIPREGFGFSMNPTITVGAPSFKASQFVVSAAGSSQRVKMKYML
jgi:uncharacterized protein (DUF2141 family)